MHQHLHFLLFFIFKHPRLSLNLMHLLKERKKQTCASSTYQRLFSFSFFWCISFTISRINRSKETIFTFLFLKKKKNRKWKLSFLGVNLLSREGKSQTGLTATIAWSGLKTLRSTFDSSGSYDRERLTAWSGLTIPSFSFSFFGHSQSSKKNEKLRKWWIPVVIKIKRKKKEREASVSLLRAASLSFSFLILTDRNVIVGLYDRGLISWSNNGHSPINSPQIVKRRPLRPHDYRFSSSIFSLEAVSYSLSTFPFLHLVERENASIKRNDDEKKEIGDRRIHLIFIFF